MNAVSDNFNRSRIKHFVGLIRVSTRRQANDNLSLEVQEHRIRTYVENTRNAELSLHVETGSASISSARRLVLNAALEQARETHGTLIVVRVDRLSRNSKVLPLLRGVKIYSLDEGLVTQARLKELITEAEREAKAISDGSKASAASRRAKGVKLGNLINLDIAQRKGSASNKARADQNARDLADIFRVNPSLVHLTHRHLCVTLNKMGFLNRPNAVDHVPWTKSSIRSRRIKAMKLLADK